MSRADQNDRGSRQASADQEPSLLASSGCPELALAVADLFRAELGLAECELDYSFFRSGGSSLAAMRILAKLNKQYGARLSLADVFDNPTPFMLAARLGGQGAAGPRDGAPASRRDGEAYPLAYSQEDFYEMSRATDGAPFFNVEGRLRFTGDVDVAAVKAAIAMVVRRQDALRTRFEEINGRPQQRVVDVESAVREVDLRPDSGDGLRRLLIREQLTEFQLLGDPLVRFTLARTAEHDWTLVWVAHHIMFDGMSSAILAEELVHAYRVCLGAARARPELAAGYADFALWQRDTLRGERLSAHLAAMEDILRHPAARVAPAENHGYRVRLDSFEIDQADADGLGRMAARLGVSLFTLLVAVALDFAAGRNGQRRQVIAVQSANRSWPGSESLIGCFSNMLCVELEGSAGPVDPQARVAAARGGLARALRHEEMPLDLAMRLLAKQGMDLACHLPQLGVSLQPVSELRTSLPGCLIEAVPIMIEGEQIAPTVFPVVLEFFAHDGWLRGATHRLVDAWPADSFAEAMRALRVSIRRFAQIGSADGIGQHPPSMGVT